MKPASEAAVHITRESTHLVSQSVRKISARGATPSEYMIVPLYSSHWCVSSSHTLLAAALDWLDAQQGVQRPGVPYKAFERQTVYYPAEGRWEEEEGEAEGRPRAKHWSVHSIKMSSL